MRNKNVIFIALFLMGFILNAAPLKNASDRWSFLPEIIAEIDGRKISREELVKNVYAKKSKLATASRDQLESLAKITLKQQIEKYIIAKLMQRDGFIPSAELALREYNKTFAGLSVKGQELYLKKVRRTRAELPEHWQRLCSNPNEQFRMAFTLWLKNKISTAVIEDEEIETFYREYQDKFRQPEKVSIRSLMVKYTNKSEREIAKEKAEDVLALLKQGVDFGAQVKKFTVPDDALTGSFIRGVLPKPIEDIVFVMESGQVSNMIAMPTGFIIIKVDKKIPAGYIPLAKVKSGLELKKNKVKMWFRKAVAEERSKIKIKQFLSTN
jgi:PPIC-type PPIASE domain